MTNTSYKLEEITSLEETATSVTAEKEYNPFPIEVFPQPYQDIINEFHEKLGFDKGYLGMGLLVVASTLIGNAIKVQVKNGWITPLILFAIIIGNSSKQKSPAMKTMLKPLMDLQKIADEEYQRKLKHWEQEKAEIEAQNKSKHEKRNEIPPKPIRKRLIVNDVTQESLCRLINQNPFGMMRFNDEISSLVKSFNQYRSGADEQFYLSLFDGTSGYVDRVDKSISYDKPFVSIIGGIQPSVVSQLADNGKDTNGFIFRFLFVYPSHSKPVYLNENEVDEKTFERYNTLLRQVYCIREDMKQRAIVPLSKEAKQRFIEFANQQKQKANDTGDESLISLYEKLNGYIPRLAGILQVLYDRIEGVNTDEIQEKTLLQAITLAEYFTKTAEMVLTELSSKNSKLKGVNLQFYNALPDEFSTSQAIEIGRQQFGYSISNIKNKLIPKFRKLKLITQSKHGQYQKAYTSQD